mgnify:CR=1 FL=1
MRSVQKKRIQYEEHDDLMADEEKVTPTKVDLSKTKKKLSYMDIVDFISSLEQKREVCNQLIEFITQFKEHDIGVVHVMPCKGKASAVVTQEVVLEYLDRFEKEKKDLEAALAGCYQPIKP